MQALLELNGFKVRRGDTKVQTATDLVLTDERGVDRYFDVQHRSSPDGSLSIGFLQGLKPGVVDSHLAEVLKNNTSATYGDLVNSIQDHEYFRQDKLLQTRGDRRKDYLIGQQYSIEDHPNELSKLGKETKFQAQPESHLSYDPKFGNDLIIANLDSLSQNLMETPLASKDVQRMGFADDKVKLKVPIEFLKKNNHLSTNDFVHELILNELKNRGMN